MREAGGQSEFRLGVAQAGNPNFAFLHPEDRLYPYYRWLLRTNPQEITAARSASLQGGALHVCFCQLHVALVARCPSAHIAACMPILVDARIVQLLANA